MKTNTHKTRGNDMEELMEEYKRLQNENGSIEELEATYQEICEIMGY